LLVKVLQKVPQEFRLRRCSLVCSAWRDAAAAASSHAYLGFRAPVNSSKVDSLMTWLSSSRGQHVTSLSLSDAGTAAAPFHPGLLPCTLQRLILCSCHLQLTVHNSLSRLTSLTRLDLGPGIGSKASSAQLKVRSNSFQGFPNSLRALTQLTRLQHLHITATATAASALAAGPAAAFPPFPADILPHLVHLTHLDISGFAVTAKAVEHLTRLPDLQTLDFGNLDSEDEDAGTWFDEETEELGCIMPTDTLAVLSGLQHLTSLRVPGAECVVGSDSTPGFPSALTGLRSLELRCGAGLKPSALHNMTGLQTLRLWCAPLRSSSSSGTQELLGVLPRLQQLTELCLYSAMVNAAPAVQQYSALVSSSKLEKLKLTGSRLPQEAWQAMFLPGTKRGQLPALREISMNAWMQHCGCSLRTQDLRSLTLSCPGLQALIAVGSVDPAAYYSVLAPLQQLTALVISHVSDKTAAGLAQLTSLKLLEVFHPNSITDAGMGHLTALRQLQTLEVCGSPAPGQDELSNVKYNYMTTVSATVSD
jgi:hypothetical protein